MLKKNLLSIAVVTAAMSLAACADKEATTDPVDPEATTEEVVVDPAAETEEMAETDAMAETDPAAETEMTDEAAATQTITELAAGNENLTILTAALQAAGLDTMLMEETKHTVFAPTDDAFAPVLEKLGVTQEELLADTDLLKKVLPYHVLASEVVAADIPYRTDIESANGATISISEDNVITDATGNTANITGTDIMATNGVVHTIDAVLMPE